jgi:hypothetical protein
MLPYYPTEKEKEDYLKATDRELRIAYAYKQRQIFKAKTLEELDNAVNYPLHSYLEKVRAALKKTL